MSIEREFLKKLRYATLLENDLREELEELLAQPEQKPKFNFDLERMKAAIESPISDVTVDDLAKQVKQEPLSDKQITKLWRIEVELSYLEIEYDEFAGIVRAVEKHHGIGVEL